MIRIHSTALPAAVTLALFVGACQDAPSSPRSPAQPAVVSTPTTQSSRIRVYSGQRADSVANEILSAWSVNGHPEYLAQRRALRAGLHLGPEVTATSLTPGTLPAHILDDGGSGSIYKDPPKIGTHHEDFVFGQSGGFSQIPSLLNASMFFVGDFGRIDARVTVTGNGATVPASAIIGQGAGQLSCADILVGNCSNSRFMEGSLVMDNAPSCDAHASGAVTFTAQYQDSQSGTLSSAPLSTSTGGFTYVPAVLPVSIDKASASCTQPGDDGGAGVAGDGGDAPPTYPAPEPAPPSYPTAGPVEFHCETTEWWNAGVLELITEQCYPD